MNPMALRKYILQHIVQVQKNAGRLKIHLIELNVNGTKDLILSQ